MKCRVVNDQEVVRQLPLVSIEYLLFNTASLFKVTAFAGVVSLYTSTFTVKWPVITWTVMCHQFSVKQTFKKITFRKKSE